jgi:hypothetical protein
MAIARNDRVWILETISAIVMPLWMVAIIGVINDHCIRAIIRGFNFAIVQISIKQPVVLF